MSLRNAFFTVALAGGVGCAQVPIAGPDPEGVLRSREDDLVALELQKPRNDLPCTVMPIKPAMDFDLSFHAGYDVFMPMKEWARSGNELTVFFRVAPDNNSKPPAYLSQKVKVLTPSRNLTNPRDGVARGSFVLGEGKYHVDWLMRDYQSRVCTSSWDVEAKMSAKDAPIKAWMQPMQVLPLAPTFAEEPPVQRERKDDPVRVSLIVNFAPQNPEVAVLEDKDLQGLVGILRTIARDPRIGEYSLVACSLPAQQILRQSANTPNIDFPALGEALESLHLGLVNVNQLSQKNGQALFVARLVSDQSRIQGADAIIIVSPKMSFKNEMSREVINTVGDVTRPVFYLNYNADPISNPFRDPIGKLVKQKRGVEYTISYPKDLFNAWSDVVSRILKTKHPKAGERSSVKSAGGM